MEPLLTMKEVATLLQVSPQTLRKWDNKLKVVKTDGGHRRYNQKVVFDFINNENYEKSIFYWPIDYEKFRLEKEVDLIYKKWKDKEDLTCGVWPEECVAIVLENQKNFSDYFEIDFDVNKIKDIMRGFLAPYLIQCKPLTSNNGLFFYKRYRANDDRFKCVIESEDYCYSIRDSVDEINADFISGLPNWAATVGSLTDKFLSKEDTGFPKDGDESLHSPSVYTLSRDIKKTMIAKLGVPESELSFWIMYHPDNESWYHSSCSIDVPLIPDGKLTLVGAYDGNFKHYTSTYMEKNKTLIGAISKDEDYFGYVFAPFMVDLPQNRITCARKLLREGAKFYGCING